MYRTALVLDTEEEELKVSLGLSWGRGHSLGWGGLGTPVWLGRGHREHSFFSSESIAKGDSHTLHGPEPCVPLPHVPSWEANVHPHPRDPSSQSPALPCVLSKSHPFLKMDGTLRTPYARFSFIILISNYLGWFPALASAAILMPADTLCSLPLLSPPFIQTTEILPTHRRAGNQGGKFSQQAGAQGVWSKVTQAPEAVGAAGRTWPGRWEPRVSLKWGVSKDAVKGAPAPSGNCCLPRHPGPHSHLPGLSPRG